MNSPGKNFKLALIKEHPLQIVGTINAYIAIMAKSVGFNAIYLSGAGIANSSYGIPDIGLTTLENVLEDTRRITSASNLPLLVDIDTGWGNRIAESIVALIQAGAAGVHIEDQVFDKRCGHLSSKALVSKDEMVKRIKTAVAAKTDPDFVIMARTDAFAQEGMQGIIDRALAYKEAGADMLFPEALTKLEEYQAIKKAVGLPILANITEFGKTPLFTLDELKQAGVDMALYPLSANRAMNLAALNVLKDLREHGTQKESTQHMQTREDLYRFLNYKPQ